MADFPSHWPEILEFLHSEGFQEIEVGEGVATVESKVRFSKEMAFARFDVNFTQDARKVSISISIDYTSFTLIEKFLIRKASDIKWLLYGLPKYNLFVKNCGSKQLE